MVGLLRLPVGLFGLPSIGQIVEGLVNFFFHDLAEALIPGFLKNASVATIKWLVAVPDPAAWQHVGILQGDMRLLAVSLLGVSFIAAVVRHLLAGLTGSGHPLQALSSTVGCAGLLVAYPWMASQSVAVVNTLTDAILSLQVVGEGLRRTVGVMFGGALVVGSGGVFLALLVIVGVVLAAVMFAMKVLVTLAFALLYVTGPLLIAIRPLPELSHLARAWGAAVIGVAIVPVGWCTLFATAGALSLDATTFGATATGSLIGGLTAHLAGAFAALLSFYLAIKLPLGVFGHLRGALATTGGPLRHAGSVGARGGSTVTRVSEANARLRAGTLEAGRSLGTAAGVLGAPEGGPAGAAARAAGRLSGPLRTAAGTAGGVLAGGAGVVAGRLADTRAGRALSRSPRGQVLRRRVSDAGGVLRQTPQQIRDAAGRASPGARPDAAGVGDAAAAVANERRRAGQRNVHHDPARAASPRPPSPHGRQQPVESTGDGERRETPVARAERSSSAAATPAPASRPASTGPDRAHGGLVERAEPEIATPARSPESPPRPPDGPSSRSGVRAEPPRVGRSLSPPPSTPPTAGSPAQRQPPREDGRAGGAQGPRQPRREQIDHDARRPPVRGRQPRPQSGES